MIAYCFDIDGYYLGTTLCQQDPVEVNTWLIPANATEVAPPEYTQGQIPRWNGRIWIMDENNKGKEYWLPGDDWQTEPKTMQKYGPLPQGAIFDRPERPADDIRREKIEMEISQLKSYLSETDYMAIKCAELDLSMVNEYPEDYQQRKETRIRINELEAQL